MNIHLSAFGRLLLFVLIVGCKSSGSKAQHSPSLPPSKAVSKEIFIGKEFFAGDELVRFEVVRSGALRADSLSYSLYLETESNNHLFSLEKLLPSSDAEKYRIVDIVALPPGSAASTVRIDEKEVGNRRTVTLSAEETILKVWNFNGPGPSLPQKWVGDYSARIDYGRLDEAAEMAIDYDLHVDPDSCTFSGIGYKTYFTDLCRTEVVGSQLNFYFERVLDGDGLSDHSDKVLLGTMLLRNGRYFLKSPLIADKSWNYNAEISLQKR